jgi:hypothetical protein
MSSGAGPRQPLPTGVKSDATHPLESLSKTAAIDQWNYGNGNAVFISMDHFMNSGPGRQFDITAVPAVSTVMGIGSPSVFHIDGNKDPKPSQLSPSLSGKISSGTSFCTVWQPASGDTSNSYNVLLMCNSLPVTLFLSVGYAVIRLLRAVELEPSISNKTNVLS